MKRKLIGIAAVVLVLALLLTLVPSCGGDGDGGVTPTPGPGITPTPGVTPTPTPEVKTIKWGVSTPFSGPAAWWGGQLCEGFEFAVDKINRNGGLRVGDDIYMVEVIKCDNKYMGSESATCAHRLAYDEGVKYVYGIFGGTVTTAARPIFNDAKCIVVGVEARFVSPEFPYYWANLQPQQQYVGGWYEQLHDYKPDIKSVAFIVTNSPEDQEVYNVAREHMERLFGAEVVHVALYEAGTVDFFPHLTPVAAKNPDAVAVGGSSGTAALQIKQLRELGWGGLFLGSNAGDPGAYVEIAGKEAIEGFLINEPDYSSDIWPEETRAIYNEFQRLFPGAQFGLCQYLGYGSAMLYKQAIERAGSIDTEEVLKVFDDPTWTYEWFGIPGRSFGGLETYGLRRVHQDFVAFSEVRDGKKVQISRKGSATP